MRGFFLALFQPIRGSVTTNMQVVQTSVLLKYSSLFAFLQRQAPAVANELQRAYVGAARLYYETGFRRYSRSLSYVKVGAWPLAGWKRVLIICYSLEGQRNLNLSCQ